MVWSGTSDERGLAMLPGTSRLLAQPGPADEDEGVEEMDSYRAQRLIAVVEKNGDMATVDGNWANGIQIWNFGVEEDRQSGTTRIRGLIQSDRGIYRPGETVHFKGLAREIAIGRAPAVPTGASVAVAVSDSRGTEVFVKKLPLTRFGGFSFDLPLAAEASTGDYTVQARLKGQTFRETFQVEEFRKVSFEVKVTSPVRHGMLGDKLAFQVAADFLFKAPVPERQGDLGRAAAPALARVPRVPELRLRRLRRARRLLLVVGRGEREHVVRLRRRGQDRRQRQARLLGARPADEVRRPARLPGPRRRHRRV